MTPKQSKAKLDETSTLIGKSLAHDIDRDNLDEVKGKLIDLQLCLASSAWCVAEAERMYNKKKGEILEMTDGLSATALKIYIEGVAADDLKRVRLADRQNAAIVHSIDALRSILSFAKEEMRNLDGMT